MKILMLGLNDPAGMMITFANAINRLTDHSARVVSLRSLYAMDYEYDIEVSRLKDDDFSEIELLLKISDVFHFHMLMDERYQIGPLAISDFMKGKKCLYHHHGTYDHQMFLGAAAEYAEMYRRTKKRAIVSTPDLLQLLPTATWQPNLVPLFDVDFLPEPDHLGKQDAIRLVQAPTRKWHKHTKEFLSVGEKLRREHSNVSVELLEGKTYRECLKSKRKAHAVFDHMNGWFGISSLESLAHGVPTVAGLDDWNIRHIQEFTGKSKLPWVIARNESQLEQQLSELIAKPEQRVEIGQMSRAFMEEAWTEQHAINVLLDTYSKL